jgi:hypothetical protein
MQKNLQVSVLIFDSGINDSNRFVIYGTENNIKYLKMARVWFGDKTFHTCPSPFLQFYTFHAYIFGIYHPLIYILIMHKNFETYNALLIKLKESNIIPENSKLDSEQAALKASKKVFENVCVYGCNFHLGQAVWRRIQNNDQTFLYKNNKIFAIAIHILLNIAFVPPGDIITYLKVIQYFANEKEIYNE